MSFVVGDLKTVEQTVELTVIEDAMTLMWRHCDNVRLREGASEAGLE